MVRFIPYSSLMVMTVCALWGTNVIAGSGPARPRSFMIKPKTQLPVKSDPQISGREAVRTGREHLGVTAGLATTAFSSQPMHRRPVGSVGKNLRFGDGTVAASPNLTGVTRSTSNGKLGDSSLTRAPVPAHRNGLSSVSSHALSKPWSGTRQVKVK